MAKARASLAAALIAALIATPAQAAGVGISLPKFRLLTVSEPAGTATSVGGSVQVVGTNLSIGRVQLRVGLDYAYTRDFTNAANYAFFDLGLGAGVPLGLTPQFYLTPALDTHTLLFAASPQGLASPAFGLAPRLTAGFQVTKQVRVELSASQTFLLALRANNRPATGGMTLVELGGSYSF